MANYAAGGAEFGPEPKQMGPSPSDFSGATFGKEPTGGIDMGKGLSFGPTASAAPSAATVAGEKGTVPPNIEAMMGPIFEALGDRATGDMAAPFVSNFMGEERKAKDDARAAEMARAAQANTFAMNEADNARLLREQRLQNRGGFKKQRLQNAGDLEEGEQRTEGQKEVEGIRQEGQNTRSQQQAEKQAERELKAQERADARSEGGRAPKPADAMTKVNELIAKAAKPDRTPLPLTTRQEAELKLYLDALPKSVSKPIFDELKKDGRLPSSPRTLNSTSTFGTR
jgi:hypothetical protein